MYACNEQSKFHPQRKNSAGVMLSNEGFRITVTMGLNVNETDKKVILARIEQCSCPSGSELSQVHT